jgi:hypothetical protein
MDPCVISDPETGDEIWIPVVTRAGMAIITRDKRIATRTAEINAVVASAARMFAVTSRENLELWGLVEVVVTQWRKIEDASREPGPYIYSVTRTAMDKIDLW